RLVSARVPEKATDAGGADAGVHLDEVRAARKEEWHAGLAGNGTRQQRLSRARGADEQNALRNVASDAREAIGVAEEVNDFLHLVLGLVHAGDVLECNYGIAALGDPRAAGIWNAAGRRPIHRETNQAEEGRDRGNHPVTERLWVGHRIDLDAHVVLHEVGNE